MPRTGRLCQCVELVVTKPSGVVGTMVSWDVHYLLKFKFTLKKFCCVVQMKHIYGLDLPC